MQGVQALGLWPYPGLKQYTVLLDTWERNIRGRKSFPGEVLYLHGLRRVPQNISPLDKFPNPPILSIQEVRPAGPPGAAVSGQSGNTR